MRHGPKSTLEVVAHNHSRIGFLQFIKPSGHDRALREVAGAPLSELIHETEDRRNQIVGVTCVALGNTVHHPLHRGNFGPGNRGSIGNAGKPSRTEVVTDGIEELGAPFVRGRRQDALHHDEVGDVPSQIWRQTDPFVHANVRQASRPARPRRVLQVAGTVCPCPHVGIRMNRANHRSRFAITAANVDIAETGTEVGRPMPIQKTREAQPSGGQLTSKAGRKGKRSCWRCVCRLRLHAGIVQAAEAAPRTSLRSVGSTWSLRLRPTERSPFGGLTIRNTQPERPGS